jgi:hypothetical protein
MSEQPFLCAIPRGGAGRMFRKAPVVLRLRLGAGGRWPYRLTWWSLDRRWFRRGLFERFELPLETRQKRRGQLLESLQKIIDIQFDDRIG